MQILRQGTFQQNYSNNTGNGNNQNFNNMNNNSRYNMKIDSFCTVINV
jgi:hypothetical protein